MVQEGVCFWYLLIDVRYILLCVKFECVLFKIDKKDLGIYNSANLHTKK
jgi:hypothetical protein